MVGLTVYGDMMSQPTRAVLWLCRAAKIEHQFQPVLISKQEQRSNEYAAINPDKKVPALREEDGFVLAESHAMMRYLCRSRKLTKWYPQDSRDAALVDKYLDWHHTNTRKAAAVVFSRVLGPRITGVPFDPNSEPVKESSKILKRALHMINDRLAKAKFICGESISIADLSAMCEIVQLEIVPYDFTPFPHIQRWFKVMKSLPDFKDIHAVFYKVKASVDKTNSSKL